MNKPLIAFIALVLAPHLPLLADDDQVFETKTHTFATGWKASNARSGLRPEFTVVFSPDGKSLVTGFGEHTVAFWDTATWQLSRTIEQAGRFLAISPNGDVFATAIDDGTLRLFKSATGEAVSTLDPRGRSPWSYSLPAAYARFSRDGRRLVGGSRFGLKVWNLETHEELWSLRFDAPNMLGLALFPDGNTLFVTATPGGCPPPPPTVRTVKMVSLFESEKTRAIHWRPTPFTDAVFSPDGQNLATWCGTRSLKVWNTGTGAATFKSAPGGIRSVAFSPDSELLALGMGDGTVTLWHVGTWSERQSLEAHKKSVVTVAFSPGGNWLAAGDDEGKVKVFHRPERR